MDGQILTSIITILSPVVGTLLSLLIGYGVALLKKKIAEIDSRGAQDALYAALNEADKVVREAILATKQTLVDDLKAKAADGKLTKEEADQALAAAKDYVWSHLTKGSVGVLEAAVGSLDTWLAELIEAKIPEVKTYFPLQSK